MAVVAGGAGALRDAAEGLEDEEDAAVADLREVGLTGSDLLVADSASGRRRCTLAALAEGRRRGAACAALVCATGSPMERTADLAVVAPVGPEIVEGSTRRLLAPRRSSSSTSSRPWRWSGWVTSTATS